MADYITRMDSMTQATDTYAAVETAVDASTPGAVPTGDKSRLAQIYAAMVTEGAHTLDSGNVFTLEIGGKGIVSGAPHEIIIASQEEQEIGTVATAVLVSNPPTVLDVDLAVSPANNISLRGAFGGTDPGSPEIYTTLVLT